MVSKSKTTTPQQPSGAPRWTYILGSIVGAAGLGWAIVSHFLQESKSVTPAPPAHASAPMSPPGSVTATATGNNNKVIGTMTGGTIIEAPPASEPDDKKK